MEAQEYGYDVDPNLHLISSPLADTASIPDTQLAESRQVRQARKEEKRQAKAKRKEERAAKKARKESKRLEKQQGLVESGPVPTQDGQEAVGEVEMIGVEDDGAASTSKKANDKDTSEGTTGAEPRETESGGRNVTEKASKKRKHQETQGVDLPAGDTADDETATPNGFTDHPQPTMDSASVQRPEGTAPKKAKKNKPKRKHSDNSTTASPADNDTQPPQHSPSVVPDSFPESGPSRLPYQVSPSTPGPSEHVNDGPTLITSQKRQKARERNSEAHETDDQLRRKFKQPGAMEEWLACQWRQYSELTRLQTLGILTYLRGKFDETEKAAIKKHLELFKTVNRIRDDELLSIIMGKGRSSERKDFAKFWPEVAAVAPGRPVKAVKDFVKREYDPRGRKGAWTDDEDKELLRAYGIHPNEWTKIANIVERTETDCRDRYKNHLLTKDSRRKGHWSPEEEMKLAIIIKDVNESVGNEPLGHEAPWDIVSDRMGGSRSRMQCRKKWQDGLRMRELSKEQSGRFVSSHRPFLVQRLKKLNVDSEDDVAWESLCEGLWKGYTARQLRKAYQRMRRELPNSKDMPFDGILDELEEKYPIRGHEVPVKRFGVSDALIFADPEDEEEDEDEVDHSQSGAKSKSNGKSKSKSKESSSEISKILGNGETSVPGKQKTYGKKQAKIISREQMEEEEQGLTLALSESDKEDDRSDNDENSRGDVHGEDDIEIEESGQVNDGEGEEEVEVQTQSGVEEEQEEEDEEVEAEV